MKSRIFLIAGLIAIVFQGSCGDKDPTPSIPTEEDYFGPILIWNLSQFELLNLYTHNESGFNNAGTDQLETALQPDETQVIFWNSGDYVSVVREKTQGGLLLGLTTQEPPAFYQPESVLIVFDDGFRALESADEANDTTGFPGFPEEILDAATDSESDESVD